MLTGRELGNATFDGHAVAGPEIAQVAAERIGPAIIAAHGRALDALPGQSSRNRNHSSIRTARTAGDLINLGDSAFVTLSGLQAK